MLVICIHVGVVMRMYVNVRASHLTVMRAGRSRALTGTYRKHSIGQNFTNGDFD